MGGRIDHAPTEHILHMLQEELYKDLAPQKISHVGMGSENQLLQGQKLPEYNNCIL